VIWALHVPTVQTYFMSGYRLLWKLSSISLQWIADGFTLLDDAVLKEMNTGSGIRRQDVDKVMAPLF
jgi:hypothetical protein